MWSFILSSDAEREVEVFRDNWLWKGWVVVEHSDIISGEGPAPPVYHMSCILTLTVPNSLPDNN